MAGDEQAKDRLIRFLDRKAFNPVLKASPKAGSAAESKKLEKLQQKTESQKQRYRSYKSAGQIRQEFNDDLHSQQAKKVESDLKKLGLPTQKDVAEEFFRLADRLGITSDKRERRHHKPHPPHPWHKSKPEEKRKAWRELKQQACKGDKSAVSTLRHAPVKSARKLADELPAHGRRRTRHTSR